MPSNRNCTASAASSTPMTRDDHLQTRSRPAASARGSRPAAAGRSAGPRPAGPRSRSPSWPGRAGSRRPAGSTAPMAPGPAISGVASGNTEMSVLGGRPPRARRPWWWCRPTARANTMSIAISSSSTPPAVRSAGRVMPNAASTPSPNSGEEQEDAAADQQRALERHGPPLAGRVVWRQGRQQRRRVERPDGREEGGERQQRGFEHGHFRRDGAAPSSTAPVRPDKPEIPPGADTKLSPAAHSLILPWVAGWRS